MGPALALIVGLLLTLVGCGDDEAATSLSTTVSEAPVSTGVSSAGSGSMSSSSLSNEATQEPGSNSSTVPREATPSSVVTTSATSSTEPSSTTQTSSRGTADETAIRQVVRDAVGHVPVELKSIEVSLVSGGWAAAHFPGPPGYEDGFVVLAKGSGGWHIVFGITHAFWDSADQMVQEMTAQGVPEDFARELSGLEGWALGW